MFTPELVGFSAGRQALMQMVHRDALRCLVRAQQAACVPGDDFDLLMGEYFGLLEPPTGGWDAVRQLVLKSLSSMLLLFRHAPVKVSDLEPVAEDRPAGDPPPLVCPLPTPISPHCVDESGPPSALAPHGNLPPVVVGQPWRPASKVAGAQRAAGRRRGPIEGVPERPGSPKWTPGPPWPGGIEPTAPPAPEEEVVVPPMYETPYVPATPIPGFLPLPHWLDYGMNGTPVPNADIPTPDGGADTWTERFWEHGTVARRPSRRSGGAVAGQRRWNYLERQLERCQQGHTLQIRLFPPFWRLPFLRLNQQCMVQTYCHELAHLAAGAKDLPAAPGHCYGMEGVAESRTAGFSAGNAESIAMFAARFHPWNSHGLPSALRQALSESP